jgi:hypothetical protein
MLTPEKTNKLNGAPQVDFGRDSLADELPSNSKQSNDPWNDHNTTLSSTIVTIQELLVPMRRGTFSENDIRVLDLLLDCLWCSWKLDHLPVVDTTLYSRTLVDGHNTAALDPDFFFTRQKDSPSCDGQPLPKWHDRFVKFEVNGKIDATRFTHWAIMFQKYCKPSLFRPVVAKSPLWRNLCTVIGQFGNQIDSQYLGEADTEISRVAFTLRAKVLWTTAREFPTCNRPPKSKWLPSALRGLSKEKLEQMAIENMESAYRCGNRQKMSGIITAKVYVEFCEHVIGTNLCTATQTAGMSRHLCKKAQDRREKWAINHNTTMGKHPEHCAQQWSHIQNPHTRFPRQGTKQHIEARQNLVQPFNNYSLHPRFHFRGGNPYVWQSVPRTPFETSQGESNRARYFQYQQRNWRNIPIVSEKRPPTPLNNWKPNPEAPTFEPLAGVATDVSATLAVTSRPKNSTTHLHSSNLLVSRQSNWTDSDNGNTRSPFMQEGPPETSLASTQRTSSCPPIF